MRSLAKNLPKPSRKINIVQGYIETRRNGRNFRVRICDGWEAFLAIKLGKGLVRDEYECAITLEIAKIILTACRHFLRKKRLVLGLWYVDIYQAPLRGIVLIERNMRSSKEKILFPKWLSNAIEVTDTLTSHDLARLATKLRKKGGDPRKAVDLLLKQRSR